jgi:LPPG:FO 2-phospho-L-lactate transferase
LLSQFKEIYQVMKVVALAGGVGGAKLIDGLASYLSPSDLSIIVNTGDDFNLLGLRICPDLDTICYTLAGMENSVTGWGRSNESWNALTNLTILGGPDWFKLGDKDLGTHLERSQRLQNGQSLSQITHDFCKAWGVNYSILPMSDQVVSTIITTQEFGDLSFQDYFVKKHCEPTICKIHFSGIDSAFPAPGILDALELSDVIIVCPSNPWVSINPILSVSGIYEILRQKPVVAVSPIIAGQALKGPAAKMYSDLGIQPSALSVAFHYKGFINSLVIDNSDSELSENISALGVTPFITNTIMQSAADRDRLARDVLNYIERFIQ